MRGKTAAFALPLVLGFALTGCGSSRDAVTIPSSTTVAIPKTPSSATRTLPPTPAISTDPGYLQLVDVETFMSGVAGIYQSTGLNWHYSKSNGEFEANTADNYCDFALVNSLGESASLIDNVVMNCGNPVGSNTREQTAEAAAYLSEVIQQFAGSEAFDWFRQEVTKAESSGSVVDDKTFGDVSVGVELGAGVFSANILSRG